MDKNNQTDEEYWYKYWQDHNLFKADPLSPKPAYSLLMPPPNVTGSLHLGHAMEHSIMDAIARYKRMSGFDVLLLPGVDHAGIQFEATVNKMLEKEGLSKHKLGREEWLKRAWDFKKQSYDSVSKTWRLMGLSADWSREVFTLDPNMAKAVLTEFQTFWDQGLLYKGAYIVQWCPKDATAIEDVEMEYEERNEKLYFIDYHIKDSSEVITIATARPETIAADVAIAVFPSHPKYHHLVGQKAINPFTSTEIPIIEDDRVEKDFGTGALKITPGHDPLDYQIGKDHNLQILHVVDKTGRITDLDPNLVGTKILEARQKAAELLTQNGQIQKVEDYTHSVPVCERCKTTVEPLISEEWFVNMQPLSKKALTRIKEVNFLPDNYQKILSVWIENIHDWCISRPLWWGYRIPVWYCLECNPTKQVRKGSGLIISSDKPTGNCIPDPDQSPEVTAACQNCSDCEWVQDEQLLDTWFSSGLWPLGTLGWPDKTPEFQKYFPWNFETSAPEIKYLWISRMIMLSLWFTDQIPFHNQFFHGMLRDLQGRKFSKSLGNGIDPKDLHDHWGTDATRMALYSYSAPGRDGKASRQTMDERCKNYRNFATKLRNITRFIIDLKPEDSATEFNPSHPDDLAIITQLNQTIQAVTKNLDSFNLHLSTEAIYEFVWHEFADKYLEQTKSRRAEAQPTLEYVLKTSLELLHPFMPFTSEELWQKLPHQGDSIMTAEWPTTK